MKSFILAALVGILLPLVFTAPASDSDSQQSIIDAINKANGGNDDTDNTAFQKAVAYATLTLLKDPSKYENLIGEPIDDNDVGRAVQSLLVSGVATRISLDVATESVEDKLKQRYLQDIAKDLSNINSATTDLQTNVKAINDEWDSRITRDEDKVKTELNSWAEGSKSYVSESYKDQPKKVQNVAQVIDDLVTEFELRTNDCIDEAEAPLKEFEEQVEKTVKTYYPAQQGIISNIQTCLEDDVTRLACTKIVRDNLRDLRKAPNDFRKLNRDGNKLGNPDLINGQCIRQVQAEFELEKLHTQVEIEKILSQTEEDDGNGSTGDNNPPANGGDEGNSGTGTNDPPASGDDDSDAGDENTPAGK